MKEVPTFKPALRWALPMRSNSSTLRSQKMNLLRIRDFALVAATASLLAACATTAPIQQTAAPLINSADAMRYAAPLNEKFPVAPIDVAKVDPQYLRQIVDFPTSEPPGTVVVDTTSRFLYLVQEDGKALRYGVGVGKEGLEFKGTANIALKREWPRWTPTQDMIKREPERYAQWSGGMEGGAENPLGPRALYLFKDGKDTLFRIHGTTQPETIGTAVSSGCIRLMNQDVIDLYGRVPQGANVVVL
ncbi:Lipoprotein-anchoring transpeptidase ErfK/SrfK [Devosia limi DSM 17137]|uniref:Lipoprotein-anchoring transpeptidase ErfK/SrfK n=3 Tax=Devosia TaxID=46913 RepID=A0A1M5EMW1_9HYPH|nr:Lipoprotein-anchoring transpeptidase ErfK/SrfK [Devosia limi DSM 17137]